MKITAGELRKLIKEEVGHQEASPIVNALATWKKLVDDGLFNLPDVFANALRNAKDPNAKRALQATLGKVQDAVGPLHSAVDDLKAVRQALSGKK